MSFSSLGSHTPRGEPRQTDNAVERKQTLWQTDSFPLAWTRSKSQTGEKPHSIAAFCDRSAIPIWALPFRTYLGYWFAGAALLSAGMLGSVLTNSTTVAFVLGVLICAVPVFIGSIAQSSDLLRGLSVREQMHDFELGIIPLSGILYSSR